MLSQVQQTVNRKDTWEMEGKKVALSLLDFQSLTDGPKTLDS